MYYGEIDMKITTNGSVSKIGSGLVIGIVLLTLVGIASATDPSITSYTISDTIIVPPQITYIDVEFSEKVRYTIAIENSAGAVVRDWDGRGVKNPQKKDWNGTYESNGTTVPDGTYTVNVTGKSIETGGSVTDASRTIEVITGNSPGNLESLDAYWDGTYIVATATDFKHPGMWYQFRFYQPETNYPDEGPYDPVSNPTGYFTNSAWKPDEQPEGQRDTYTYSFNVLDSGAADIYGGWTVWLFKDGVETSPPEEIVSERVWATVNVPIPEFSTIALPVATVLGIMFFMSRRKQKK